MMMWPNVMSGFFGGGFMWMIFIFIFVIAVIIGIILLIVWLIKRVSYTGDAYKSESRNALEVLNQRYAKGEITEKEYGTIKKDIG